MKNIKACAKKLIDEMHDDDVAAVVDLLEHLDSLRETIDVLHDPETMADLKETKEAVKKGRVKALADV